MVRNCKLLVCLFLFLIVPDGFGNIAITSSERNNHKENIGFLDVSLIISNHHEINKLRYGEGTSLTLSVCLASLDNHAWTTHECVKTEMVEEAIHHTTSGKPTLETKYTDLKLPLFAKVSSSHLVVMESRSDGGRHYNVIHYTDLSPHTLFANNEKHKTVLDTSTESSGKLHSGSTDIVSTKLGLVEVSAVLSLHCAPHHYGPLCATLCVPPSDHHRCDITTGELKCAEEWTGRNCRQNVFISHQEASHFIKHRAKRANSWHRGEEINEGNIERECNEEMCSREEAREAFEDDALTEAFWTVYTDPDHCNPNQCVQANTVRCEDLVGDYVCRCKPGYRGKTCGLQIDVCESQPCQNGGLCQRHSPTSFACVCQPGFRGLTCQENINDCIGNNCGEQGVCQDGINNYTCVCNAGFTGPTCDVNIDDCESSPCQNGGTCTDQIARYTCDCPEGYDGLSCEDRISPCASTPCLNSGRCDLNSVDYTYTCNCTDDYVGSICEHHIDSVCGSSPCLNGGVCYHVDNDTEGEFYCDCSFGYRGSMCEEAIPTCELYDNLCSFNSTCVSLAENHICVCPEGLIGSQCQFRGVDGEGLRNLRCQDENPCQNGARCLSFENKTICVCRTGFNGTFCEEEFDFCDPTPCKNTGQCLRVPTGFHCNCSEGYRGRRCEFDVDECSEASLCGNGTCVNTGGSFSCDCDPFSTGRLCEQPFDPCSSTPCANGGSCSHSITTGYMCDCLEGYGGTNCELILQPCTNYTNPCANGANCTIHPQNSSQAVCVCPRDIYGPICDKARDNCAVLSNVTGIVNGEEVPQLEERDDCGDHGQCISDALGFYCHCNRGFVGTFCEQAYVVPIVNCTSEDCICPTKNLNEVEYHRGNKSLLQCKYYDMGNCRPTTCLAFGCSGDDYQCNWPSECLSQFLKEGHERDLDSFYCPVLEIVLDAPKLENDTTVEYFCDKIRGLSDHNSNETTVHCSLMTLNRVNSTVAVAFGKNKQKQSILQATEIFQTLEQVLKPVNSNRVKRDVEDAPTTAENLDPIFYHIVAMRFSEFEGKPQSQTEEINEGFDYMILVFVFAGLVVLVIMVVLSVVLYRKRRRDKGLQVTYVVNPNARGSDGNSGHEAIVTPPSTPSGTPVKPRLVEDFINPMFVDEKPTCHALTSRPSVHDNTYVSVPYATASSMDLDWSKDDGENDPKPSGSKKSSKKTKPEQYEVMSDLTLPFDTKFPPENSDKLAYDFASDGKESPKFELKSSSSQKSLASNENKKNSYEEIEPARSRGPGTNAYETIDLVFGDATHSESDNSSSEPEAKEYNFATEMPSVGIPEPFQSRTSSQIETIPSENNHDTKDEVTALPNGHAITSQENGGGVDKTVLAKKLQEIGLEEHYQIPNSLFTDKDQHFPNGTAKSEDIYATPRKPNPTE